MLWGWKSKINKLDNRWRFRLSCRRLSFARIGCPWQVGSLGEFRPDPEIVKISVFYWISIDKIDTKMGSLSSTKERSTWIKKWLITFGNLAFIKRMLSYFVRRIILTLRFISNLSAFTGDQPHSYTHQSHLVR